MLKVIFICLFLHYDADCLVNAFLRFELSTLYCSLVHSVPELSMFFVTEQSHFIGFGIPIFNCIKFALGFITQQIIGHIACLEYKTCVSFLWTLFPM